MNGANVASPVTAAIAEQALKDHPRMAALVGAPAERGYRVRVVDHRTQGEATFIYPTLEAVAENLRQPIERVTPDRFGFALLFNAELSASIITIGGLTDQAGA